MIMFIYLSYFESKPNYLESRLLEMDMKEYRHKIMILLLDKEDEMNYIQQIQFKLIAYRM